jgi:uroporphyrinogen decarboxylase
LKVFDSWAGILSPDAFLEFSLPYLKQIEQRVKASISELEGFEFVPPMIVFPKGAHYSVEQIITQTSYDVLALDWETNPEVVRELCRKNNRKICLQGNLDPCVLFADDDSIRSHTKRMLEQFHGDDNILHIANLGHGITPAHSPDKLRVFVDAVHEFSVTLYSK